MRADEPLVAVVVLNYNGLEDTLRCLESLKGLRHPRLAVVLVDNGSEVDPESLARYMYAGLHFMRNSTNLGYAGGNNCGIELALSLGAEFVMVLNNDTTVSPVLVERLLRAFAADTRLGIAGPVINYMDEPDRVMTDGVRFNPGPGTDFFQRIEVPAIEGGGPPASVDIVNGCCMMIRAVVFPSVGLLDERLFIVHEESDFCLRTLAAGYGCAVVPEVLVWHKGSSSFERAGRQLQRYYDARNLFYLLRRHSGTRSARPLAASLWHYARYAYYRYATEIDAGKPAAAQGVIDGVSDALLGRTGPRLPAFNTFAPFVRVAFGAGRVVTRTKRTFGSRRILIPKTEAKSARPAPP